MLILHWRFDSKRQLNTKNSVSSFHSKVARARVCKNNNKSHKLSTQTKALPTILECFPKSFLPEKQKKDKLFSAHETLYFFFIWPFFLSNRIVDPDSKFLFMKTSSLLFASKDILLIFFYFFFRLEVGPLLEVYITFNLAGEYCCFWQHCALHLAIVLCQVFCLCPVNFLWL